MADRDNDRTLTSDEHIEVALPQAPPQRLVAPLQRRDPERYEILGEHGRGGLGVVSRAHDRELGRDVAIKEILSRDDVAEIRFLREALITARLEHPGIVPVHEAGRWPDGTPFYVMKLVAGRPLKELLAERPTVEARLELLHHMIAVADAVAYAHKRKIIHRDLKASNVIAGDFGETVVIDWGLAKDLSAADGAGAHSPFRAAPTDDLTAADGPIGTPLYMAPEQRRGEPVDPRTDVYAIGLMLWQLCSLEKVPPAEPRERASALRHAGIDQDLAAIIDKALAADPGARYRDAGELAADLKAFKAGARIAARRYSVPAVLAHWIRRHRALAVTIAAAVALVVAGVIAYIASVTAERDRADAARAASEQEQRRAEQEQQRAAEANDELVLQNAALQMHRDPTAVVTALAGYHGKDQVRREMLLAEARGRGVARTTLAPHANSVWFMAGDASGAIFSLSQDRRLRVTRGTTSTTIASDLLPACAYAYSPARGLLAYTRAPDGIAVLDLRTLAITPLTAPPPRDLAITPDGARLAALDASGVTVWELSPRLAATQIASVPLPGAQGSRIFFAGPSHLIVQERSTIHAISLTPGQRASTRTIQSLTSLDARDVAVVAGDEAGRVILLSRDLTTIATVQACHQKVNSVRFADQAHVIAFACQDNAAGAIGYDEPRRTMTIVATFPTQEACLDAKPDPRGMLIVASTDSNVVYSHDVEHDLTTRHEGHGGRISSFAAPTAVFDGILAGSLNGTIRVWDSPSHAARVVLRADKSIFEAAFTPDDRSIVTDGEDGVVHSINVADGTAATLRGHESTILKTIAAPDGRSVLSYGLDGTIRTWDLSTRTALRVFSEHGHASAAEYIEEGRRIASVGDDGRLLAWSPREHDVTTLFTHPQHQPLRRLTVLALPRDPHLVTSDTRGSIWSVSSGGVARLIRDPDGSTITALQASPDGTLLAVGSSDDTGAGSVTVYRTSDYQIVHRTTLTASIRKIRFDPRHRDILIISEDGRVRSVALSGQPRMPWTELAMSIRNAAYSDDGETIAFVCMDGGAWFYSFPARRWIYARDHTTDIFSGNFSHDGTSFVSADRSGTIVLRNITQTFQQRGP